jgi:hypothetical protein
MNPRNVSRPNIDPKLEEKLAALSIHWDQNAKPIPGRICWRRSPVMSGDATWYSFTTREGLDIDGFAMIEVMDAVYEAGLRDGRQSLREALKRLIAQDEP